MEVSAREQGVTQSDWIRGVVQNSLTESQFEDEYELISKKQVDNIGPVVWIITTLSEKTPEAFNQVLMWRSEDPHERHRLLNKALQKLQVTRPATWKWVEQQLAGA